MSKDKKFVWSKENPEGVYEDYTEEEIKQREKDKPNMSEKAMLSLRELRNNLLAQTDWVVIKEKEEGGSVSNFADWKKYRQELRDITKTYKSLEDVKWPTAPSE